MRPSSTLNFLAIMILLGCAAGFSAAQEANPEGSYQQTCSDISVKKGDPPRQVPGRKRQIPFRQTLAL